MNLDFRKEFSFLETKSNIQVSSQERDEIKLSGPFSFKERDQIFRSLLVSSNSLIIFDLLCVVLSHQISFFNFVLQARKRTRTGVLQARKQTRTGAYINFNKNLHLLLHLNRKICCNC